MDEKTFIKGMVEAIKQGDLNQVVILIKAEPEYLHLTTVFGTWLHFAASKGKLEIIKYLVSQGLDINANSKNVGSAYTPINAAASNGQVEIVRYLLSCGSILDVSKSNHNPLFSAVLKGHVEIVKLLIEGGIDAKVKYNSETMKNMDALALAYEWGQNDIIEILRPYSVGEPVFYHGKYYTAPDIDDCYIFHGWKSFDTEGNRLCL